MLFRHPWRLTVGVLVGLLLLLAAYAGWLVVKVEHSLVATSSDAESLKSAMTRGDIAAVKSSLRRLAADSHAAARRTDSPVWSLMTHLPVYGDDVRGVKVASNVVSDLSTRGLPQLADSVHDLNSLAPKGGRIDLAAVERLQQPVATGARQLAAAQRTLAAEDPANYVAALKDKFRALQSQIDQAASALGTADTALQVMPAMLGANGPQRYLLILQNNAEIRATGGLPGAVSLVEADHGALAMTKQVAGSSFGERQQGPVLPLTADEKALFHEQLGTYFLDANLTPDFPRAADLWRARWEEVQGDHLDGVLSVDPVTLSYLLKATGPIPVPGRNVTLTSANVVDQLLHQTYLDYPAPSAQDAFFRDVATAVFQKVAGGAGSPEGILKALVKGASEHRVQVHDFHDAVQSRLAGSAVAGEFTTRSSKDPVVNVALDDATGAKMSYYLRYQTSVSSDYCTGGVQGLTGTIHMASDAPADAASLPDYITGGGAYNVPKGGQVVMTTIAGPVGGTVGNVLINGKPSQDVTIGKLDGRPTAQIFFFLSPGKTWDVSWQMKTGTGQTGATQVDVTPSIVPGDSSSTVASSCGG